MRVVPSAPTRSPRGRPRPEETIRRDERILALVRQKPMSRNQICEKTRLSGSLVWLSLNRLRLAGEVKLCQGIGERVWTADTGSPCP